MHCAINSLGFRVMNSGVAKVPLPACGIERLITRAVRFHLCAPTQRVAAATGSVKVSAASRTASDVGHR